MATPLPRLPMLRYPKRLVGRKAGIEKRPVRKPVNGSLGGLNGNSVTTTSMSHLSQGGLALLAPSTAQCNPVPVPEEANIDRGWWGEREIFNRLPSPKTPSSRWENLSSVSACVREAGGSRDTGCFMMNTRPRSSWSARGQRRVKRLTLTHSRDKRVKTSLTK